MIFFAHQNDSRDYNALKKYEYYSNIHNFSLSEADFLCNKGVYSGEIYEAINNFSENNPNIKRIHILLNGTGGQHSTAMELYEFLRVRFDEINVYVFGNAASALGMIALAADKFYAKEGPKYKKGKSASIGKFDVQIPFWLLNDSAKCLKTDSMSQVSLEKLLVAYLDFDKLDIDEKKRSSLREKVIKSGHQYLLDDRFRKYWSEEYKTLVDPSQNRLTGLAVLKKHIDEGHVDAMFATYEYFSEQINRRHSLKNGYGVTEILTSPTSDMMAMCEFGKGIFHHGSRIYSYDFSDKLGINYEKIDSKGHENSFIDILEKINQVCFDLVQYDVIKKVFGLTSISKESLRIMCGVEKVPESKKIEDIEDYFGEISNLEEHAPRNERTYHFAFRGQSKDYGYIQPSIFREKEYTGSRIEKVIKNIDYEMKRYDDSLKYCIDIFSEEDIFYEKDNDKIPKRFVSYTTPNNLSKQQHYGLPTRLTDLSHCPLLALYMACSDVHEKDSIEFGELSPPDDESDYKSKSDGVIYVFPYQSYDYNSLFEEQKVLFLSHLVKLSKPEKDKLFLVVGILSRYNDLLQRYCNFIYRAVFICPKENFLSDDFSDLYSENKNPYVESLDILIKKISELDEDCYPESQNAYLLEEYFPYIKECIIEIVAKIKVAINKFTKYEDEVYSSKRVEIATYLKCFYLGLDEEFFNLARSAFQIKGDEILEKLFGDITLNDRNINLLYASFLFGIGNEALFVPDYSMAANARLKNQKGLFLISGCEGRISTDLYYKFSVNKEKKDEIRKALSKKSELEGLTHVCPARKMECRNCYKNGINFQSVYGDLYGISKYIDKCHDFCESHK